MPVAGVALVGVGYLLGSCQVFTPGSLFAQGTKKPAGVVGPTEADAIQLPPMSDEAKAKIRAAHDALKAAQETLQAEGHYQSATKGVNAFTVLSGGGSSVKDLEAGRGVDPETFAALYADLAIDEVAEKLGKDPEGRITYNNKVVRMYPVSKLKYQFTVRGVLSGTNLTARVTDGLPKPAAPAVEQPNN